MSPVLSKHVLRAQQVAQQVRVPERAGFRDDGDAVPGAAAQHRAGQAGHDAALHLEARGAERVAEPAQGLAAGDEQRAGARQATGEAVQRARDPVRRVRAVEARRQVEACQRHPFAVSRRIRPALAAPPSGSTTSAARMRRAVPRSTA